MPLYSVRREASTYTTSMSIRDLTYFPLFCHYRGVFFCNGRGYILPVSHQEGTILTLSSSGETINFFLLDNSCVGPVRFGNTLPTAVPIFPNPQNQTTYSTVQISFRKKLVYLPITDFRG